MNCINPLYKREAKDLVGAVASVPLAWHTFEAALSRNGSEANLATAVPPADPRQLFFLLFCCLQCGADRGEQTCNEPLRHSRDFARVYGCAPGSSMNPAKKCDMSV
ncbi:hypothetical protein V5799_014638 [Amblyomma americanum]|uniref:Uncharacterized protein n=1 Tax=Amblyomma americanum TaxID=6943 RepID=A0AAQ4E2F8_AMBAM